MGLFTIWAATTWHHYHQHLKTRCNFTNVQAFHHNRTGFNVLNLHNSWVKQNNFAGNNKVIELHSVTLENGDTGFVCKFVGADGAVLEKWIDSSSLKGNGNSCTHLGIIESVHLWGNAEVFRLESLPTLASNVAVDMISSIIDSPILHSLYLITF